MSYLTLPEIPDQHFANNAWPMSESSSLREPSEALEAAEGLLAFQASTIMGCLNPPDQSATEEGISWSDMTMPNFSPGLESTIKSAFNVECGDTSTDEVQSHLQTAIDTSGMKNPYGFGDLELIAPLRPSEQEFVNVRLVDESLTQDLSETLVPPPCETPPTGYCYPESPIWRRVADDSYTAGLCYAASVSSSFATIQQARLQQMSIAVPPGVDPVWNNTEKKYLYGDVAGCVTPPASVPLRLDVDGVVSGSVTYAAFHTPKSLMELYPTQWSELEPLCLRLQKLVFGVRAGTDNDETILPIYAHEGLKRNNRSAGAGTKVEVLNGKHTSYNGSYSLTITVNQGLGVGTVKPVSQVATKAFQDQLLEIVQIIRRLYQDIVPLSISKFEWEMSKFQLEDNNVFTAGGLDIGPLAIQMNISDTASIDGADLGDEIGPPQGKVHPDPVDAITLFTKLIILLRIPEGAVGGSTLLARYGVQLPFQDAWIVFCIFDAHFLHGSRNVCIHPDSSNSTTPSLALNPDTFRSDPNYLELQRLYAAADKVKRAAFVCYFPHQAVFRTGNYAVTPSVNFGNTGTLSQAELGVKTFAGEGEYILGSRAEAKSRLAREMVFAFFNGLSQIGCQMPGMSAQALLSYVGYEDPSNPQHLVPVLPPQYDVLNPNQSAFVEQQRQHLSYYYRLRKSLLLNINQKEFFSHQEDLLKRLKRLKQNPEHCAKRPSDLSQGVSIHLPILRTDGPVHSSPDKLLPLLTATQAEGVVPSVEAMVTVLDTSTRQKRPASPDNNISNKDTDSLERTAKPKKKQKKDGENRGAVGPESQIGRQSYQDYEVESIVEHEFFRGHYIYLVKFCGWPLNRESDWYKQSELSEAKDILLEYIKHHGLIPATESRYPNADFTLLADLFDQERLQQQYIQLGRTLQTGREAYTVQDPLQRLMKSYTTHNDRQFTLTSLLQSQLSHISEASIEDQSLTATVLLDRLITSLQILPQLTANSHIMQIWNSSIHWQYCRSILVFYDFISRGLPELSELLFMTYKNNRQFLLDHYSGCGRLVSEIMKFLEGHVRDYRHIHRDSTKASSAVADQQIGHNALNIPGDLYGLRAKSDDSDDLTIVLRNKSLKPEKMYDEGKEIFADILIMHLVVPHLPTLDGHRKQKNKASKSMAPQILDDYLMRGAVLQAIVDETDDESIFASADIQPFLFGSILPLWDKRGMVKRIASQICNNPDQAVAHIRQWLTEYSTQVVKNLAFDFGSEVHRQTLQYVHGRKLSESAYNAAFDDESPTHSLQRKRLPDDPRQLLLSDTIQQDKDYIAFGVPALIAREVLNERANKTSAIQSLGWYLRGLDHTDGSQHADGDRDQRDPRREVNIGASLLHEHMPSKRLATKCGLSNLLSWHGTGQGNVTAPFLAFIRNSPSSSLFSESVEDCIQHFCTAKHHNESILAGFPNVEVNVTAEAPPAGVPGLLRLSNCRIYGTASNALKLLPTSKTLKSYMRTIPSKSSFGALLKIKFEPYWVDSVITAWCDFLGDLLNQDPSVYQGYRHSWSEALDFVDALKIAGFRRSLTAMQVANAMAFARLINPPSLEEMAHWIWNNQKLGGFAGLRMMGFALPTQKAVLIALTSFCEHIWGHTSSADKAVLRFEEGSVIAAEHWLCKISRWSKRISDMEVWALDAERQELETSQHRFAFPLIMSKASLAVILNEVQVGAKHLWINKSEADLDWQGSYVAGNTI